LHEALVVEIVHVHGLRQGGVVRREEVQAPGWTNGEDRSGRGQVAPMVQYQGAIRDLSQTLHSIAGGVKEHAANPPVAARAVELDEGPSIDGGDTTAAVIDGAGQVVVGAAVQDST